jgi:transcriptional regulator with XRE-family HTH domain
MDLHGAQTQHPGVYCRGRGNALSSSWHGISHRFTEVYTRGRGEKGDLPVERSLYGERDYAFGQLMLTLRTHMGLTQARLAQRLGVSRRAVSTWELGSNYPAPAHLKELIVLGVELQAFPAGREEEEIRAFWRAAHQKVLLDGRWLSNLLGPQQLSPPAPPSDEQAVAQPALGPPISHTLDGPTFSGREGVGDAPWSEAVVFRDQLLTTKFFITSPSHDLIIGGAHV